MGRVLLNGCRVHPDKTPRAYELCATCYSRIVAAASRHREGLPPTAVQAQTLTRMGRPTLKMLEKWPTLPEMIAAAKTGEVAPLPETGEVVALIPSEPVARLTPPVDLAAVVSQLQARAELGRLALDLRQDGYRDQLVSKLAEAACHGLEDDAAALALPLAVQELSTALESLSSRLEWVVMQQATDAEGVG